LIAVPPDPVPAAELVAVAVFVTVKVPPPPPVAVIEAMPVPEMLVFPPELPFAPVPEEFEIAAAPPAPIVMVKTVPAVR